MKLKSVTLRNYRLHRDTHIEFDGQLTVITGMNETGKSTIADGIYQALFLKFRGDTKAHRAIESSIHGGDPEVTLRFQVGNHEYELQKHFTRGRNASAMLTQVHGRTWRNDEAETELGKILAGGGMGVLQSLFVRQGHAADDPTEAFQEVPSLTARLRTMGGASVVATVKDDATLAQIQAKSELLATPTGRMKSGGAWEQAETAAKEARNAFEAAHAHVQSLMDAERRYQQALSDIASEKELLQRNGAELRDAEQALETIRELDIELRDKEAALKTAQERLRILTDDRDLMRQLYIRKRDLENEVLLRRTLTTQAQLVVTEARGGVDQARGFVDVADRHARMIRYQTDLTEAVREQLSLTTKLKQLLDDHGQAKEEERGVRDQESRLAGLAVVTDQFVGKLEVAERESLLAKARVEAMGAQVRVLGAAGPVIVDGRTLVAGDELSLTREACLTYGDELRLTIAPGASGELAQAQADLATAQRLFASLLDEVSLQSLGEVREIHQKRKVLESSILLARTALQRFALDRLPSDIDQVQLDLTRVQQRVTALSIHIPDFPIPSTIEDAVTQVSALREALESADEDAQGKRDHQRAAEAVLAASQADALEKQESLSQLEIEVSLVVGQLAALEAGGSEQERLDAIQAVMLAKDAAAIEVDALRARRVQLQPDSVVRRRDRLKDAIRVNECTLDAAKATLHTQKGILQRGENDDPEGDLKKKEAEMQRASRRAKEILLRCRALHLVMELYGSLKREAAEVYGGHLAAKIREYIQELYGPNAAVKIEMDGDTFAGISISHQGTNRVSFDFGTLSGGTMEQVSAAAKMAMAELMMDDGEPLPVILDDSFTNTDQQRLGKVKDMLALAKQRGLQVVLLSCSPQDFSGLGGKHIRLESPAYA